MADKNFVTSQRKDFLFKKNLTILHCRWNAHHQDLDRIDEMKHLPLRGLNLKNPRYCCCLLEGDLMSDFDFSLLQPTKMSQYCLCSEV